MYSGIAYTLKTTLRYELEFVLSIINSITPKKFIFSFFNYHKLSEVLRFQGHDTGYMRYIYDHGVNEYHRKKDTYEVRGAFSAFNYRFNYNYEPTKDILVVGSDIRGLHIADFYCNQMYFLNCFFDMGLYEIDYKLSDAYTVKYTYVDIKNIIVDNISPSIKFQCLRSGYSNINKKNIKKIGRQRISWKSFRNQTLLKLNKKYVYGLGNYLNAG